jgi:hypothetical protein
MWACAHSAVLCNDGIVQHMLSYMSPSWLYIGAVSRLWQQCYERASPGVPHTTTYSAAFASVQALRWACSSGLDLTCSSWNALERSAGKHADLQTLAAAYGHGLRLIDTVMSGAIMSGRVEVVRHLLTDRRRLLPKHAGEIAGVSGSIEMLKYLRKRGCELGAVTVSTVAAHGHLPALKYLLKVGCNWWKDSILNAAAKGGNVDMVKWLLQRKGVMMTSTAVMTLQVQVTQLCALTCAHRRAPGTQLPATGLLVASTTAHCSGCTPAAVHTMPPLRASKQRPAGTLTPLSSSCSCMAQR